MYDIIKYPKINSIFKRDNRGKFLLEYSTPEISYLANNNWEFTEKLDGMNIRVIYQDGKVSFAGRTDRSQIPVDLLDLLQGTFSDGMFNDIILFGEGVGPKIQSKQYELGFVLFDAWVGRWLTRPELEELDLPMVPGIGTGTLQDACVIVKDLTSRYGNFIAEGVVCKPMYVLLDHYKHRIITKMKYCDRF